MKDQLVSLNTSVDLIEKARSLGCVVQNDEHYLFNIKKWLGEKHGLCVLIIPTATSNWTYRIVKIIVETDGDAVCGYDFSSFVYTSEKGIKKALEDGIKESLKLIKNEK